MGKLYEKMKPFVAVVFLQFAYAVMDVLSKVALNNGMSNYVYVVYRHAVATIVMAPFAFFLEKKTRPKMTFSIIIQLLMLGLLEPVINSNLFCLGMKNTTATFAVALINLIPGITFLLACILRIEKIKMKSINSQAKIFGTLVAFAGAMLMTLVKGPKIIGVHTSSGSNYDTTSSGESLHSSIKGSVMILVGCLSGACFIILQAITLETYPAALSLAVWICLLGTVEGAVVALIAERENPSVWYIKWDTKLLAVLYSGIVCTGLAYYIQGVIMKVRGPVFVTAFTPLGMIIVAVSSLFILSEQMSLGKICGAIVIVIGLYLVIWGKRKDDKSESPAIEDKQTIASKEMIDQGHNKDEILRGKIIIINVSNEGSAIFEKQKCDKGGHSKDEIRRDQTITIDASDERTIALGKHECDQGNKQHKLPVC